MTPVPPQPIRITHVIGTLQVGGAEGQLVELIRRLPRDRFEQRLVLTQGGGPLRDAVEAEGCPIFDLGWRQNLRWFDPRAALDFRRATLRLRAWLRRTPTDILHGWLYWANLTAAFAAGDRDRCLLSAPARTRPLVITSRRRLRHPRHGRGFFQLLANLANQRTDAILVNSEAVRRDVLVHERVGRAHLHRIYNGVDLSRFEGQAGQRERVRRQLGLAPDDIALLVVANLHPFKGHDDLLRAMARLAGRFPGVHALFPGRDAGAEADLRRLTAELGLAGRTHFLGVRRDVPDLLAAADLFVHVSHEEGFSNAILEAMAAARPVVVSAAGGNTEAVTAGQTGLVVPPADPAALAAALEDLLANPARRAALAAAARRRIETEFSLERMIGEFAAWYERLMKEIRP